MKDNVCAGRSRIAAVAVLLFLFLLGGIAFCAGSGCAAYAESAAEETFFAPTKFLTAYDAENDGYAITGFDTQSEEWIAMTAEQRANIKIRISAAYEGSEGLKNVTAIGDNAFNREGIQDENKFTSLDFSEAANLKRIGENAFRSNIHLSCDLKLPDGVTEIGNYAFSGCGGLSGTLTLPTALKTIGDYAFKSCGKITGSLTIPDGVTKIGGYAFNMQRF